MSAGRILLLGNHRRSNMTERPITKGEVVAFVCTLAAAALLVIISRM